jgi:type IV pilus assembly protein PilV
VQSRSVAIGLADELMSTALVDPANLACYTVPAAGSCGNAVARTRTDEWAERATDRLPGSSSAIATVTGTRLTVVLGWTGKESNEARQLTVETDVQ